MLLLEVGFAGAWSDFLHECGYRSWVCAGVGVQLLSFRTAAFCCKDLGRVGGSELWALGVAYGCQGRWGEVGERWVAHMGAPPSGSAKSEGSEGTMNDGGDGGESSRRLQLLHHDTGLDLEWSASEQSILNDGLAQ